MILASSYVASFNASKRGKVAESIEPGSGDRPEQNHNMMEKMTEFGIV